MTIIEKGTCDVVFDHKGAMLTKVPPYSPATKAVTATVFSPEGTFFITVRMSLKTENKRRLSNLHDMVSLNHTTRG